MSNPDTESFQRQLDLAKADYQLVALDNDSCQLDFIGPFNGEQVIWHARLQTLQAIARSMLAAGDKTVSLRQFIEIEKTPQGYQLNIGLNLQRIDDAAIKRTIIMIRKYKRLHMGRHDYGEAIRFEQGTGV